MYVRGIFRVVSDGIEKETLGTAFAFETVHSMGEYYLLTAYHVISEMLVKEIPIIVQDECGDFYDTKILTETKLCYEYIGIDRLANDYAILSIRSDKTYLEYYLHDFDAITPIDCFVVGAANNGITLFTDYSAKVSKHKLVTTSLVGDERDALEVKFITTTINQDGEQVSDKIVLRGLSGAPVLIVENGNQYCIGIMRQVGSYYSSEKKYAIPIRVVENDINSLGIDIQICAKEKEFDTTGSQSLIIELLSEDLDDFNFENNEDDARMWGKISDLFYKGYRIDIAIDKILKNHSFVDLKPEVLIALYYYLIRIYYKRNCIDLADHVLEESRSMLNRNKVSDNLNKKYSTLCRARQMIEGITDKDRACDARRAVERIVDVSCLDGTYANYEICSLYGKYMINLFSRFPEKSFEYSDDLIAMHRDQTILYEKDPQSLKRQDVVITAVDFYLGLWKISDEYYERLEESILKGFELSLMRKNDIFHVQCLMSSTIRIFQKGLVDNAATMIVVCVKLIMMLHISERHEGIYPLITYMKYNAKVLYNLFNMVYRNRTMINDELVRKKIDGTGLRGERIIADYHYYMDTYYTLHIKNYTNTIYKCRYNNLLREISN